MHNAQSDLKEPTSKPSIPDEVTPFDDGALYDLFLGDFLLDLACGTGRILLPCLQAGVDIEGLDLFEGMLARLRQKASALGLNPTLHRANMDGFRLPRRYALIMIPFNAFIHNVTTNDQLATLQACREHLEAGGLLVFDTSFPGQAWIGAPSGKRELEMEIAHPDTGLPVR